jgi:hypothetical protein
MTQRPAPVFAAALLALLAACASPAPSASSAPSASPSPGSDVAVVRIDRTGGMLPQSVTLEWYPTLALYADGQLITLGPVDAIYPPPALPSLIVTQLTPNGVAQVLQWAAEAGLRGPDRELGEPLLDSGTTNITVVTDEGRHVTRVWDMSADDPALRAIQQFRDVVLDIRSWLAGDVAAQDRLYDWDRLRIISQPRTPDEQPDPAAVTLLDWPLPESPLADLGVTIDGEPDGYRCAVIDGSALDVLRPQLGLANGLSLWRSEGRTFAVVLHPLLPDDEGCPGL